MLFVIRLLSVFMLLLPIGTMAQRSHLWLHRDAQLPYESLLNQKDISFHTGIRPYRISELRKVVNVDSVEGRFPSFLNKWKGKLMEDEEESFSLSVMPLFNLQPGTENDRVTSEFQMRSEIGFSILANVTQKVHLNVNYTSIHGHYTSYVNRFIEESRVVPSEGYAYAVDDAYHTKSFTGSLSYAPSKNFDFQIGQGKHFWGEGYRSLLLSDVTRQYPFFKATTTVWKLKYVNLFTNFKDVRFSGGDPGDYFDKFGTFHLLSYQVTPRLNIGLFESVIWQGEDTLVDRGFDVNYLNPVIFFRPVEFSTGSADNSLIGLQASYKVSNRLLTYGQVIIDEFLLREVRGGNGWWGNKQGGQLGLKYFDALGVEGLQLQGEYNYVRPYTYTHGSSFQNYGHFNQPLAHPLGANFWEANAFATYAWKNWIFAASYQWAEKGEDYADRNLGGNIFLSSDSRDGEFSQFTGQGRERELRTLHLRASYLILPLYNLRMELGWIDRDQTIEVQKSNSDYFYFSLRTALSNFYSDF